MKFLFSLAPLGATVVRG